jgi:hypothetical protein
MLKAFVMCVLGMTCLAAQAGSRCQHVGGTVSTNFIDSTDTFGSATGDLAGGIGVSILSLSENSNGTLTFHNQHRWVTTTGDTINTDSAFATGFPTTIAGFYAAIYADGVNVTGGTGRFENASGKIYAWGAVNTKDGEVVLRYEGTVCYAK